MAHKIPAAGLENVLSMVNPSKDSPQLRLLIQGHKYLVLFSQLGTTLKAVPAPDGLRTQL